MMKPALPFLVNHRNQMKNQRRSVGRIDAVAEKKEKRRTGTAGCAAPLGGAGDDDDAYQSDGTASESDDTATEISSNDKKHVESNHKQALILDAEAREKRKQELLQTQAVLKQFG